MNIYQTVCFLSVAVFCVKRRKDMELCQMLIMLSVFGGMLCHLLWEAKGRYVFSYYVMLLPFAAFGVKELVTVLEKMLLALIIKFTLLLILLLLLEQ